MNPPASGRRWASGLALGATVVVAAVLAVLLHRHGHTQGDDFALYLRQARSIFDGDPDQVVADNRFSVIFSGGSFSPFAYPWGLPLLLSPFVRFWGLDYDRLKLVIVAAFAVWMVLVHGVVRRRLGRPIALALTLTFGTIPVLLAYTDQLLSEIPHAVTVAVLIWWLDRMRRSGSLIEAPTRALVVLGLLLAVPFEFRRESVVLPVAVAIVQAVELAAAARHRGLIGGRRWAWTGWPVRAIALPHLVFAAAVAGFQVALPSMLLPDNADSGIGHIPDRLREYPAIVAEQVGYFRHHALGLVIVGLVLVGIVAGVRRRPGLDGPLAAIAVISLLAVSTHFRLVEPPRYYFQVVPWVLYFGTVGVLEIVGLVRRVASGRRTGQLVTALGVVPLIALVAVHVNHLPSRIANVREFNDAGRQQVGPTNPTITPIFAAVRRYTAPDDVIWYYRARTMTLLTDRRAIQTQNSERGIQNADYFAMQRWSDYYEPPIDEAKAIELGFTVVWQDQNWILYDMHPAPVAGGKD